MHVVRHAAMQMGNAWPHGACVGWALQAAGCRPAGCRLQVGSSCLCLASPALYKIIYIDHDHLTARFSLLICWICRRSSRPGSSNANHVLQC